MPPDRSRLVYSAFPVATLALSQGVGAERHLRVTCPCGRDEEFDATELLQRRLGGRRIGDVQARLRCRCGRLGEAKLDVYRGRPARFDELPEIYRT